VYVKTTHKIIIRIYSIFTIVRYQKCKISKSPCPDWLWGPSRGTRGFFPRGKVAGVWSWPFTSI